MSSTILEQMRMNHESIENYEREICNELDAYPNAQRARVLQQHKVSILLDGMVDRSKDLLKMYDDEDGLLGEELESMKGDAMFSSFYASLNTTREYHQRFPVQNINATSSVEVSDDSVHVHFSGEEVYGKYLDLHACYQLFMNLPSCPARGADYLQYLDMFASFFAMPAEARSTKAYNSYLQELWNYLKTFLHRVQPLINLSDLEKTWIASFKGAKYDSSSEPLRLGMFNSVDELEALGPDRLQQALTAIGLKAGGTVRDRAERLWAVRGKKPEDYPKKYLAKVKSSAEGTGADVAKDLPGNSVAWLEHRITKLTESMADIVTATRRHAEKQQTRKPEEKEAELLEEELGVLPDVEEQAEAVGDGDEPLYNPLNLPLGWDGKPIPYWLYKLHGLGVEYKCEICGNQSYWGRRNFDRHFQEWRHAHGMRCLGVPNTKHFHDITLIEDALALYAKIKQSLSKEQFVGDAQEEFEDSQGNVLNRRTYEDLARQGLL